MRLFKYRSLNPRTEARNHTLDILQNGRLHLSPPSKFNDPYDCRLPLDISGFEKVEAIREILSGLDDSLGKLGVESVTRKLTEISPSGKSKLMEIALESAYDRGFGKVGITSFSGEGKDSILLMWAHYAESHKGICFVFSDEFMFKKLILKVEYVPVPPKINVFDLDSEEVKRALTTKSTHWSYEDEYRIVIPENANSFLPFEPSSLVGIQFGLDTLTSDKEEIIGILKEKKYSGVKLYQVEKSDEKFELIERELERN